MSDDSHTSHRPAASGIRALLGGFSALVCNRAELLGVELHEQKIELLLSLQWLVLSLLSVFIALLAALALIVFITPAEWRIAVFAGLTVLFAALGLIGMYLLHRRLEKMAMPFSTTVAEIRKDFVTLSRRD